MPNPCSIALDERGVATFGTEEGNEYKAVFLGPTFVDEPQLEGLIFDFSFERTALGAARGAADGRVWPTVEGLIRRFFDEAPFNVMSYTCESSDARDRSRLRLFGRWHRQQGRGFVQLPFLLPAGAAADGAVVGALLFRADHPLRAVIEECLRQELRVYAAAKQG